MLIYSVWHLNWFWIELYQAVIWFCYRNKYTVGMYSHESETHKENLELGLKTRWLSTLKVKEFSTVFKIYYHFAPFSYKSPPYWCCASSYYFNNLYSCRMYHNNTARVECVLMKEYAVSLLTCIRPLWTGVRECTWKICITSLYVHHRLCLQWQEFGGFTEELVWLSVLRWDSVRDVYLLPDLLRYPVVASFPSSWRRGIDHLSSYLISVEPQQLSDFLVVGQGSALPSLWPQAPVRRGNKG